MNRSGKILIINNNMKIGGVQKALLEVLKAIHRDYDVTLLLFQKSGALLDQIPADVKVVETSSHYRYLGLSQGECKTLTSQMTRGIYAVLSKALGISWALRFMDHTVKHDCTGQYDAAISFLQCARFKSLYGGAAEYALRHVQTHRRLCWIHCDYQNSGTCSDYSRSIYRKFDRIVCVSRSVREAFLQELPELENCTSVLKNPLDAEQILRLAKENPYVYEKEYLNVLTVARLAAEKGIGRMIQAAAQTRKVRYYIAGEGPMRGALQELIAANGLEDRVFLLGEQDNPYRFLAGADLLAVPSFHEAAPVVYQEAAVLGVPVFTTRVLSAEEMIMPFRGIVVDNSDEEICRQLKALAAELQKVRQWKAEMKPCEDPGEEFQQCFKQLLGLDCSQDGGIAE